MKSYKIDSTGFVFSLPESLKEVTFIQWIAVVSLKERKPLAVIEVLVSNVTELRQSSAETITQLYQQIRFMDKVAGLIDAPIPKRLAGIQPLLSISETPIKQLLSVHAWVDRLVEEGADKTPFTYLLPILAVYLGGQLSGRRFTDFTQVEPFIDQISTLPCTKAVPVAFALYTDIVNPKPTFGLYIETVVEEKKPTTRLDWSLAFFSGERNRACRSILVNLFKPFLVNF